MRGQLERKLFEIGSRQSREAGQAVLCVQAGADSVGCARHFVLCPISQATSAAAPRRVSDSDRENFRPARAVNLAQR